MVFQNPDNQFVGTTVQDDVAFGLENHGIPRKEMIERVHEALRQVKMSEFSGSRATPFIWRSKAKGGHCECPRIASENNYFG